MLLLSGFLWLFAGFATVILLIVSIARTVMKDPTRKLWIATGVSFVASIVLFLVFMITPTDSDYTASSTPSSASQPSSDKYEHTSDESEEVTEESTEEETTTETVAAEESEADELEEEIEEPTEETFNPDDYQTGVELAELERRPDDFTSQKFMYQGKIVQVMEDEPYTAYRVAVNDDYDRIAYIQMFSSTLDQRYLEDDYITFYGHYEGLLNYETVIGGEQTVPSFTVNGSQIEMTQ